MDNSNSYRNAGEMYRGEVSAEGLVETLKSLVGMNSTIPMTAFRGRDAAPVSDALSQPDLGMPAAQLLKDLILSASPAGSAIAQNQGGGMGILDLLQNAGITGVNPPADQLSQQVFNPYVPPAELIASFLGKGPQPSPSNASNKNQQPKELDWTENRKISSDKTQNPNARAAALEANNPGFKVQVKPDGSLSISGSGQVQRTTPSQMQVGDLNALTSFSDKIIAEKDQEKKIQLYTAFEQNVAVQKAALMQGAWQEAERQLDVQSLEAEAKSAELMDQIRTPGQISPLTASLKQKALQARNEVAQKAEMLLKTNSAFGMLQAQSEGMKSLMTEGVRRQNVVDQKMLQDELTTQRKAFEQEQEDKQLVQSIGPEAISRMKILHPEYMTKSEAETARFIREVEKKDPGIRLALTADERELPEIAFLAKEGGKIEPMKVLIEKERAITGKTSEEVMADLRWLESSMSPVRIKQTAITAAKGNRDEVNRVEELLKPGVTKEETAEKRRQLMRTAFQALSIEKAKEVLAKPGSIQVQDEEFQKVREKVLSVNGNASMKDILIEYLGKARGASATIRAEQFISVLNKALVGRQKSLLAPIDKDLLAAELVSAVRSVNRLPFSEPGLFGFN